MTSPYLLQPLRTLEEAMEQTQYRPQEGTVTHGTMRPQDLLRAFSRELAKFNGHDKQCVKDAQTIADYLDFCEHNDARGISDVYDQANYQIDLLVEDLNDFAPQGLVFCSHEGDGSDFGWWAVQSEGDDNA